MMSVIYNLNRISKKHISRSSILSVTFALLIIAITILIVPFGKIKGPVFPDFVLIDAISMSIIESLIAYFFAAQFIYQRDVLLAALAGAFGYVAILVFAQAFVFPGIFSPHSLSATNPQSSAWMWVLWHAGFPLYITFGILLRASTSVDGRGTKSSIKGLGLILAGPATAIVLVYFCNRYGNYLPILITGVSYQYLRHSIVIPITIVSTMAALLACIVGRDTKRNLLHSWLTVALLASLGDVITSISGDARYDLGWYAGKILNLGAVVIIFFYLIYEISRALGKLAVINRDLEHLSMHDGLTGVCNRHYFAAHLPREVLIAKRNSMTLSLLMIDIDHFKQYNDTYGHLQGDKCLVCVATAISDILRRPGDFVARYGGEEFVALLPQTDSLGARLIAERIRSTVAALQFRAENGSPHSVTVSIGFETFNGGVNAFTAEELIRNADLALYDAKHSGRNRVRAHFDEAGDPFRGEAGHHAGLRPAT